VSGLAMMRRSVSIALLMVSVDSVDERSRDQTNGIDSRTD
jgi:hypothetical protein